MFNGREGVEGVVRFEKPVVKVIVDVAEDRACSSVAGWTLVVYWPGRSTYDVPDELNTAPTAAVISNISNIIHKTTPHVV